MQDLAGKTLGKYHLLERIGKGGMSVVYRAFQPGLERHVAVKALLPHLADSEDFVRRFRREAQAVAGLRHPNIVQVFDFDYDQPSDTYYMVMEHIEGETLKARLARLNRAGQRLAPAEVAAFFDGLLAGVGYAHQQGMVHRDLKPANVMFARTGRTVLTDFGIARILGGERFTATGVVMGTPVYMCPENALGEEGDARSDLYSLGIVLYESLTGQVPFDADTSYVIMQKHLNQPVPALTKRVPDAGPLEPVLQKALAKSPAERYQTAEEMQAALRAASRALAGERLGGVPAEASTPGSFDSVANPSEASTTVTSVVPPHQRATTPARPWRLRPRYAWAAALAAVALLLGGWLFYSALAPARQRATLDTAQAQLEAGDFAAALDGFDAALARAPRDPAAHLGRAEALLGLGRPDDALAEVEGAAEQIPNSPELLTARGRYRLLYTSGPDVEASLADFDAALALQADYAPAYLARGWARLNFGGDAAGALADLREAVRLNGANPETHRTLAAALSQSGDSAAALAEIQAAIQLKSDDPEYFVESAAIQHTLGDLPAAERDLDGAVALRADFSPYYAMRAYVRLEQGHFDAALADANAALQLNPGDAAALYARGLVNLRQSDYAKALADLDAVLQHEPFEYQSPFLTLDSLREINLDRALVLQAMPGRAADTLAAFDAATAANPDWFAVYFYRGVYLAEQGMPAEAQADLEQAARLAPDAAWQGRVQEQLDALGQ